MSMTEQGIRSFVAKGIAAQAAADKVIASVKVGPYVVRRAWKARAGEDVVVTSFDYLTARGSWTTNPGIAQRFDRESVAYLALRSSGGKGEIIPESRIGK